MNDDLQMRKSVDLKDKRNEEESTHSENGNQHVLGPRNMQNPQGESMGDEEESKEDIVELAENDRLELERLTQGGVAAVNKQI